MATFNSTTFGSISGRHGSAVAATTKEGKSYLRIYRAPSDPKTEKQVAQRSKFAFANKSLSCFRNLFKETFNNRRGMNIGVSFALKKAIVGEAPDFSVDYTKLTFSVGSVNQLLSAATTLENNTVTFNWDYIEASFSKPDDMVSFIFFNEETQLLIHQNELCLRAKKSVAIDLPEQWAGSTVYCWVYLSAVNGQTNNYSESQFVSQLQL